MSSKKISKANQKVRKRERQRAKYLAYQTRLNELSNLVDKPDILGLEEYARIQQTTSNKDRYASTIPFDIENVTTRIAARILEKTKANWVWFENARELDAVQNTSLGTLNHLPQELRDAIYLMILDEYLGTFFEQHNFNLFGFKPQLKCYLENFGKRWSTFHPCLRSEKKLDALKLEPYVQWMPSTTTYGDFRAASPSLRKEFEYVVLHNAIISFRCPSALTAFFDRLSPEQLSYTRRISIEVFGSNCSRSGTYNEWRHAIEALPSKMNWLKMVSFDLGYEAHPIPLGGRLSCYYDPYRGVFVRQGPTPVTRMSDAVSLLELLTKQMKRRAPHAKIAMLDVDSFLEEDRIELANVFSELE